jgi:hypothetical protein
MGNNIHSANEHSTQHKHPSSPLSLENWKNCFFLQKVFLRAKVFENLESLFQVCTFKNTVISKEITTAVNAITTKVHNILSLDFVHSNNKQTSYSISNLKKTRTGH